MKEEDKIAEGYYTDTYFNRAKEILEKDNHNPIVRMQVFQKHDNVCLCGIKETLRVMHRALGSNYHKLTIKALKDGDMINANETVMLIEGEYRLFAHLETIYLGILARASKIATNVYNCAIEAKGKDIFFFPARFDYYLNQPLDGYAYWVGMEAAKGNKLYVSTDAQGSSMALDGSGTMPHSLIASYGGDTVKAMLKFAEHMDPDIKRVALVDYDNDCVTTSLAVARAMHKKDISRDDNRYDLWGIRLDTSGNMVDESIRRDGGGFVCCRPDLKGVNPTLVKKVSNALFDNGFNRIKIIVSGGFTPEKIKEFEGLHLPVHAYGVGSSLLKGSIDFTADIVSLNLSYRWKDKPGWKHNAKVGRQYNPNERLKEVK